MKKILIIIFFIFLMLWFFIPKDTYRPSFSNSSFIDSVHFGIVKDYGYVVISGRGNFTLVSLNESPKSKVYLFDEDYVGGLNGKYYPMIKNISEKITSFDGIHNSIIIIASGALPIEVLNNYKNITKDNYILYLGRENLVYNNSLVFMDIPKHRIFCFNKTLDQFSEHDYQLLRDFILYNNFSINNTKSFYVDGTKTEFIPMSSGYMRLVSNDLFYDSPYLNMSCKVSSNLDLFPNEKSNVIFSLNGSPSGFLTISLFKDGKLINQVLRPANKLVYYNVDLSEIGDYILLLNYDNYSCGSRIHIKNLTVNLSKKYGNYYEFLVFLDGKPKMDGHAEIYVPSVNKTYYSKIINGKFGLSANLGEGDNKFIINIMGRKFYINYKNTNKSLLLFYFKSLAFGGILLAAFFVIIHFLKKPIYRISIPEGAVIHFNEMPISYKDIKSIFYKMEDYFGWKKVPLYSRELAFGLKMFYTNGLDVTEANVEAIMRKLIKKGLVEKYLDLYQLKGWPEVRLNALKRKLRDKLVSCGIHFKEKEYGFDIGNAILSFKYIKTKKILYLIFENLKDKYSFLDSLPKEKQAEILLKIKNEKLKLCTLEDLDGFL